MTTRKKLLQKGAWFFLFNSFFLLLIASRYFQYFAKVDSFLTAFYLSIATISHFVSLSMIIYAILYLPIIAIFPKDKFAWIWAAFTATLGNAFLLLDSSVYQLYRFHINGFVLDLIFGGGVSQILQFSFSQYLMGFLVCVVFVGIMLITAYYIFKWQDRRNFRGGWWFTSIVMLMMFGSHFIHAWADAANYTPITKSSRYYPLYFPTTAKELMLKIGMVDKIEDSDLTISDENKSLNYPKHMLEMPGNSKTNIILILIDSWYYKVMDSTTMPNIYAFSKKCEIYKHHYSGSNGTRTGVFSIFYSIPGIYWDDVLASQTGSVLIDGLLKNNYDIQAFASATLTNPPFERTIFKKIKNLRTDTQGEAVSDRDKKITEDWLNMLNQKKSSQPLFGFMFYDALHAIEHPKGSKAPFKPEWEYPKYELLNNDMDPGPFYNLYKNTAVFVDSLVGVVLNDLEKRGMLKDSWVIITGDHGQEFNDNKKNYWGHNGNYSAAQMQVPLFIYKPNGAAKNYSHWTSHYDLVPTIFTQVLKCKNPISDYSVGQIINNPSNDRKSMLVGSKDNFAILERNRITSVYFDGSYDITDEKLNEKPGAKLDAKLMNCVMMSSKEFYK